MSVKINALQLENVKRVKLVEMEPQANGLTIIGGDNDQGKSSVLDAIAWALGGDKFRPSMAKREGSLTEPYLKVTLSNGLVVERKGKNSALVVTDSEGKRSGQRLLDCFIEQLALDLPKFMAQSNKEKATTLLRIIGLEDELRALENEEQRLYNRRLEIGRIADQKEKYARELPEFADVPPSPISAVELIRRQQDILAKNLDNRQKRERRDSLHQEMLDKKKELANAIARVEELKQAVSQKAADYEIALKSAEELVDESTAELEADLENIEAINIKIRANLDKEYALDEAKGYQSQYDELTAAIAATREAKLALLDGAELPLEGLGIEDSELVYQGQKWDNMSSSQQLMVGTAIIHRLNPECGFVLLDKLEQMDNRTLAEFGAWLKGEHLQAIATRVSKGDECQIIIEDGYSYKQPLAKKDEPQAEQTPIKKWKAGEF